MKVKPLDKRTEDENTIIDFALIYESILPKMYFYKIEDLILIQGFDLISQLVINFKHLGIKFIDLPITYQSIFGKIEICMFWYDDSLKKKILEFYLQNIELMSLDTNIFGLHIVPNSLLKDINFAEIIKHHAKFRIKVKWDIISKDQLCVDYPNITFKDQLVLNNDESTEKLTYEIIWFDLELKKELNDKISNWNRILKDFIGFNLKIKDSHGHPKYSINIF